MKSLLFTCCFLLISMLVLAQPETPSLLPGPFDLPGMQLAGDPELFVGEDLFDLINGGAEVYLEYGFTEVATQNYQGMSGKTNLRVEIYKMNDPGAAYGIFIFNTTGMKITDKIGYYLASGKGFGMMQKGSYYIVASYANIDPGQQPATLNQIVASLDKNIQELSEIPPLLVNIRPPCPEYRNLLYFRGPLALQNHSYLDFDLPFNYRDGVFYRCDVFDFHLFYIEDTAGRKSIMEKTISNILNKHPELQASKATFGFSIHEGDVLRYELLQEGDRLTLIKYL